MINGECDNYRDFDHSQDKNRVLILKKDIAQIIEASK